MSTPIDSQTIASKRKIRSFVRREGRITPSQQFALDTLWPRYGIEATDSNVDFAHIFGRKAPVSFDIGFGNGVSTLSIAEQQADWNHIGIEVHRPGVGRLLAKLEEQKLNNVRVICADAVEVMTDMVADASVDRILIFFPDPWHKKRHHKRRIIQPDFVKLLTQKLKSGAHLHLATDWQPYAQWMLEILENETELTNTAGHNNFASKPDYRPTTKFETRGHKLGHDVFDLIYRRV